MFQSNLCNTSAKIILQVFGKGAKFSLYKPAEEMVYISLDNESRTKGKAAIDVVGAQTGKSIGSILQQVSLNPNTVGLIKWRTTSLASSCHSLLFIQALVMLPRRIWQMQKKCCRRLTANFHVLKILHVAGAPCCMRWVFDTLTASHVNSILGNFNFLADCCGQASYCAW